MAFHISAKNECPAHEDPIRNCIFDPSEKPIQGVTITLYDVAGNVIGARCDRTLARDGDESGENQDTTHANLGRNSGFSGITACLMSRVTYVGLLTKCPDPHS